MPDAGPSLVVVAVSVDAELVVSTTAFVGAGTGLAAAAMTGITGRGTCVIDH